MLTREQEKHLADLREKIVPYMGAKRLSHTLGVEREITALSGIYAPDDEYLLRVSALLHDITKKLSHSEQLALCDEYGIAYSSEEKQMPKVFHSRTAAIIIERDFKEYAYDDVISNIRFHTTGRADMTIGEILLYLADYIEDTRTFEDCVKLRRFFYEGLERANSESLRKALLENTLMLSFDMTINGLLEEASPIHADTVAARNFLVCHRSQNVQL